nr:DUF4180 domain-containing protein [Tepidanaerobacter sp. GT38]
MIDSETLFKDFFASNRGYLGTLLQKFTMYNIKAAIIMRDQNNLQSEFMEAIAESQKRGVLKLFADIEDAEKWFLSLNKKSKGELKQ